MNNADIHDSSSFFPIYVRIPFKNEGKLSQLIFGIHSWFIHSGSHFKHKYHLNVDMTNKNVFAAKLNLQHWRLQVNTKVSNHRVDSDIGTYH